VLERRVILAPGLPLPLVQDSGDGSLTGFSKGFALEQHPAYSARLLTGHDFDPYAYWHSARHRWISF
jgi:hypothetical protein